MSEPVEPTTVEVEAHGQSFLVKWPHNASTIQFQKFKESSRVAQAEVTVKVGAPGYTKILRHGALNLLSVNTQAGWARILKAAYGEMDWDAALSNACLRALRHFREGEPFYELTDANDAQVDVIPFHLNPFVFDQYATIVFGVAGIGKSKLAWLMAMIAESQQSYMGIAPGKGGRALVLDYETDVRVAKLLVKKLRRGTGLQANPLYRRCMRPLLDELGMIEDYIVKEGITFLVIDSLGPACGADLNSAETPMQFVAGLRALGVSSLILAHTAKAEKPDGQASIYGNVFFGNLSRSYWEMRGAQEPGTKVLEVGLWHRKCNLAPMHAPLGFLFTETDSHIALEPYNLLESEALAPKLPLTQRIEQALKTHGPASPTDLLKGIDGTDQKTISAILGRARWARTLEKRGKEQVYEWHDISVKVTR